MARALRAACFCLCGLLVMQCGDPSGMGPNTAIFGEPEAVGGGTAGAAETVCQKLEACGLLSAMQSSSSSTNFGLQVGQALYAQSIPFGDGAASEAPQDQPSTPMGLCLGQIDKVIGEVDQEGVQIPWDTVAYCVASASCSSFLSNDGLQQLAADCMSLVGVAPGGGSGSSGGGGGGGGGTTTPSDAVCERAANKLRSCINKLDCNDFEGDLENKAICEAYKKADTSTMAKCEGSVRAAAEQIDGCNLDELCRCSGGGGVTPIPDSGPPPADGGGGGSVDNFAACQNWVDSISCGSWDAGSSVNCDSYKNVTSCDLTDYFNCLTENFSCGSGGVPDTSGWSSCYSLASC